MGRREGIRGGTRRASLCLHAKRRLLQKGSGVRCGAAIWATALHESVQGISGGHPTRTAGAGGTTCRAGAQAAREKGSLSACCPAPPPRARLNSLPAPPLRTTGVIERQAALAGWWLQRQRGDPAGQCSLRRRRCVRSKARAAGAPPWRAIAAPHLVLCQVLRLVAVHQDGAAARRRARFRCSSGLEARTCCCRGMLLPSLRLSLW